ncbi:hypothetical protein [Halomicronema hongdechloris]|uniref:hypothetical protein n=1 Tax=Halomicronema hongdechloris TaxID=1209493 RepID=UPI0010CC5143|nr:hypothetical protein [Halomicronema hongdechloris]
MAEAWAAHVLPHSPITELVSGLWHVIGVLRPTPREMVIYRLPDGCLLIHSAIALDEASLKHLESLGTPTIMIVPNRIHRIDAAIYKRRYPQLAVVAPAVAKPYVEEVVAVDAIAEEWLPDYGIICHTPNGIRPQELVYELPLTTGKALLFTDILFNLTDAYLEAHAPRSKWLLRWLGAGNQFGITALGQRFFMTDKAAYRQWLQTLADTVSSLRVISVAHGAPITKDCSEQLRSAANRLA